jgi:hypothetical protein
LLLLRDVIPSLPPAGIARCADYALFPLLAIARAQRVNVQVSAKLHAPTQYFGERNKEMALECIRKVLEKSKVTNVEQFLELLQVFTSVLQSGIIERGKEVEGVDNKVFSLTKEY